MCPKASEEEEKPTLSPQTYFFFVLRFFESARTPFTTTTTVAIPFAPADDRNVVGTIIEKGRVSRPIIGITFLESARANTVGIKKGVLVLEVEQNTSAANAGLRPTTRTQVEKTTASGLVVCAVFFCFCLRGGDQHGGREPTTTTVVLIVSSPV